MNSKKTRTPYNSIYEIVQNVSNQENKTTCCLHGLKCAQSNQSDGRTETEYANLPPLNKEEKVAAQLVEKLGRLETERRRNKRKDDMVSIYSVMKPNEEEKRKNNNTIIDTDQSYVVLGSFSCESQQQEIGDSISDKTTNSSTKEENRRNSDVTNSIFHEYYVGVKSKEEAEQQLTLMATKFILYHQLKRTPNLEKLSDSLPLILSYKQENSNNFRHYPIIASTSRSGNIKYFLNCGDANIRKHCSLSHLIAYYHKNQLIH